MRSIIGMIIIAIVVIVGLILMFFKIEQKPDINYHGSLNFKSKDAYGCAALRRLLESKYDQDATYIRQVTPTFFDTATHTLLVLMLENLQDTEEYGEDLTTFLNNGNALVLGYISFYNNYRDSISYVDNYLNLISNYTETYTVKDSTIFIDNERHSFTYQHLQLPFWYYNNSIPNDSLDFLNEVAFINDAIFHFTDTLYKERFSICLAPYFFTNIMVNEPYYLPLVNKVFTAQDIERLYVSNDPFSAYRHEEFAYMESPLKYILSVPSLKYAYFTILLGAILFFTLGSKRTQRPVPILQKSKMSQLEYLRTLSDLFKSQGQHHKIVLRIEDNFKHFVSRRYLFNTNEDRAYEILSKKSEVNFSHLKEIENLFKQAHNHSEFTDKDLSRINGLVEYFYKNCK